MNSISRIRNILIGVLMIASGFILFLLPDLGYYIIAFILGVGLIIYGIRSLVYYFTMTHHMVGGKRTFYIGKVALDMGAFALSITLIPQFLIMLYLQITFGISGAIDLFNGLNARKSGATHWRRKVAHGLFCIAIMLICILYSKETAVTVWVFSGSLVYAGIRRIIGAFKQTSIAYIQ